MTFRDLALALCFSQCAAFAGSVYWTDRGASELKRMDFHGTNLETITLSGEVASPGSNVRGIAIDLSNQRIFWADNGSDRLLRASLDGSAAAVVYAITGGNSFPADVRLDLVNQHFYWCDQLRRRIQRSAFDGGEVTDVITNAAATGPYFMDLDLGAGKIYWGDFDGGAIFRANLDGSERETLLTGNNRTRGVAVDPRGGMLYWINRDDKMVHRCPLTAFAAGTIALSDPAVQTLYTGLDTPHGLVLDLPARKMYWADTGGNAGVGTGDRAVSRGDLDGSTPMEVLATGVEPWDVDLDRRCTTYAQWSQRCFRRDAAPEQTDPGADPDNDGVANALEYAYNLPPLETDSSALPQGLIIQQEGIGVFHGITFTRRTGTTDLSYRVEVSTNLVSWSASPTEPEIMEISSRPLGDDMEEVTARTTYPVQGFSSHFLRVAVQLAR
jgi:sugar lactone lactonase YvrE